MSSKEKFYISTVNNSGLLQFLICIEKILLESRLYKLIVYMNPLLLGIK